MLPKNGSQIELMYQYKNYTVLQWLPWLPETTRMTELGPISVANSRMAWYIRNTKETRWFSLATKIRRQTCTMWISLMYENVHVYSTICCIYIERDGNAGINTETRVIVIKKFSYDLPEAICDVISEKGPYCGRNSVFLDQLFLHFCDIFFYQNCAGSEKYVSFRCSLATNIEGPDQTPHIMRGVWSGTIIFVVQ